MLTTSEKLIVFQQLITCATPILFTEYDARTFKVLPDDDNGDSTLYFLFCLDDGDGNWWTSDGPNFESLRKEDGYRPIVRTNSLGMIWIAEIEELDGTPYRIHTLGPVFASDYSVRSINENLSRHKLSDEVRREVMAFVHSIPVVSAIRFYEYALMLHWCLTGERITLSDLTYLHSDTQPAPDLQELSANRHGTYLAEQRMLQSVRDGNLQYAKAANEFASAGYTDQFLAHSDLRFLKNYAIIYTALCCRAAVEGGLDVETAYTLSDQYLENIENAGNLPSLHELTRAMVKDYIERVHRAKNTETQSPQIRMACEWIALSPQLYNIHSLAEKLGYTDYYFSKIFKKETGKSVNEYILLQKIETAKRLLTSTSLSVAEISDRLGIESQSYFTSKFRMATGMTPIAYRNSHQN